ncbi:MAG TPA: peptide-methionine (S)-S-oxide reductase MsrA [Xanthomonadaceae bacterium]|nr:peptide-methionine (S)-S-oxide reductase MsrA [Xanthomonadaceae bacterium]
MIGFTEKMQMPRPEQAPPGRSEPMPIENRHFVHGRPLQGEFPGCERVLFGMGCFWGAERLFWSIPGVYTTAVGYAGGFTPNPTYREVCSGLTGHDEVVLVIYQPQAVVIEALLKVFWESHDPTQGMRQGNDVGTQYRSGIYCFTEGQQRAALASRDAFQGPLRSAGLGAITTEIVFPPPAFYYAEDDHQQYLAKNPGGYCGLGGTGVCVPG